MAEDLLESGYTTAALKALESFAIKPSDIELVARSENVTFRVSVADSDTDLALRLHRPGYNSIEELNSERVWTMALYDAGIAVQESFLTRQGKHFALVDIPGTDDRCYAGMTTWLEGTPLSDHLETYSRGTERAHYIGKIGELAATMHNLSTQWQEPPGFTRPRLDLNGLLGETPRWGRFWEHQNLTDVEEETLLQAREDARIALTAYGERPDNFSVTHADLHPNNIVWNGADLALIDFDDLAYGWHMYELASVLVEYRPEADFDALGEALLDGYRKHRSLAQRDVEMLSSFVLLRGMVTLGWFQQRPEHAGSEYYKELKKWVVDDCVRNSSGFDKVILAS